MDPLSVDLPTGSLPLPLAGQTLDPGQVGNKAARLSQAVALGYAVPTGAVIPVMGMWHAASVAGIRHDVERLIEELRYRHVHARRLATRLQDLIIALGHGEVCQELARRSLELAGSTDSPTAVRSSSPLEDETDISAAGLYLSRLNISGVEAVARAVAEVWASAYSPAAVTRWHAAGREPVPIGVIVQRMCTAEWSGVAFSHHPLTGANQPLVEATSGTGEDLVGGSASPALTYSGTGPAVLPELALAAAAARQLARDFGWPVDVEWAAAQGQLRIVQVRPITTLGPVTDTGPDFCVVAPESPEAQQLARDCGGALARFVFGKKTILRLSARQLGIPCVAAAIMDALPTAITAESLTEMGLCAPDFTVGCGSVRGIHVTREELVSHLKHLPAPGGRVRAVVRDNFLTAGPGILSTPLPDGRVLVEWYEEGLLAATRGLGHCERGTVAVDGTMSGDCRDRLPPETWSDVGRWTLALAADAGAQAVEWYVDGVRVVFSDATVTGGEQAAVGTGKILSPGRARGRVVKVPRSLALAELSATELVSVREVDTEGLGHPDIARLAERIGDSAPAVVVAPCPWSALSLIVGHACGFIFEQGGLLSHLAITLREARIPAVFMAGAMMDLDEGQWVTLPDIIGEEPGNEHPA